MIMETIAVRTVCNNEKQQGGFKVMAQIIDVQSGQEYIATLRETNQRHFSEEACDRIAARIEARGDVDSVYWSFT